MKTEKELSIMSTEKLIKVILDLQKNILELQEANRLLKEELARAKKSRPSPK